MTDPKSIPHPGPGIEGGWVWVPREPTEAMVCAGDGQDPGFGSMSARVYRAMLSSAPQQPSGGWRPDREAIARIIEPSAWERVDKLKNPWGWARYPNGPRIVCRSLAKADAILALPSPPVGGSSAS